MFEVHSIVHTPVSFNCYVLFDKVVGNECVIVDLGSKDENELFDYPGKQRPVPMFIILSHEHFDHC